MKRGNKMRRTYLKLLKYFFVRQPQTPMQLIHFVTSKCNARCSHCFFWSKLNTKDELSLEEITKITKHLPDLTILNISGGEPFLRPDFAEVIKAYYRNTPVKGVAIPTNGTLTEKTRRDCINILENCPDLDLNVVVSLDGLAGVHDEVRQVKGCFTKAIETFAMLRELKKQYPRLQVSIISTLTALNQESLEEFHGYVKNKMQPDVFSMNLIRGEAKKMDLFKVDINYYRKFFSLEQKSRKRGMKSWLRDYMNKLRTGMIIRTVEEKKFIVPCRAGTLMAVMYEKGDVFPCELLNDKKLGNIRDFNYDFRTLWRSKAAVSASSFIKKSRCFCTHECFQRFNIIYNPSFVARNLAASVFGKSKTINALKSSKKQLSGPMTATKEDENEMKTDEENMIQIGRARGVRYNECDEQ